MTFQTLKENEIYQLNVNLSENITNIPTCLKTKLFLHSEQENARLFSCFLMCLSKSSFTTNVCSHSVHMYFGVSVWIISCRLSSASLPNSLLQTLQMNGFTLLWVCWCFIMSYLLKIKGINSFCLSLFCLYIYLRKKLAITLGTRKLSFSVMINYMHF